MNPNLLLHNNVKSVCAKNSARLKWYGVKNLNCGAEPRTNVLDVKIGFKALLQTLWP